MWEDGMSEDKVGLMLRPNAILQGEELYIAAIDRFIAKAEHELLIFTPDLSKGAYQSRKRYEVISAFLAKDGHHKLILIMHNTDYLTGRCALLMDLLKIYSHSFTVFITDESAYAARDTILLADGKHYLHRFHADQSRFKFQFDDEISTRALNDRFSQLLEISHVTGLSSVIGL